MWEPSAERVAGATITRFAEHVVRSGPYDELWRWSVEDLDAFWAAVWEFFGVEGSYDAVLGSRAMPGAEWFPGAKLSYARHLFAGKPDERVAILHASELRPLDRWTWGDLRRETARIRGGLAALGVGEGDRVCAYLPNIPETIAAFLATASLGAIWSTAAPEFGARSVIDRFAQLEPKVLLAIDGYRYGGKDFDRSAQVAEIHAAVGGEFVRLGHLDGSGWQDGFVRDEPLEVVDVPFAHPLWVLFSSGTTGLPKAIVHSQGGILLEHLKTMHLHIDAQQSDNVFWFTTTGWMMWNFLVGILLTDAAIVLYDGSPADEVLWDLAEQAKITVFGTSAAFITAQMKDGAVPTRGRDLSRLHAVGSTGSPLSPDPFQWVYDQLGEDTWLFSTSGGTDVCTAFVGGVPTQPVYRGELQARALACDVRAFDDEGGSVVGEVGELVITQPMPSMPVFFWNDPEGERYRESYFEMFPGVWRHGDWVQITERGTAVIYGRSDSTINRAGVRMGTSEIYRAVLALDEIIDALVVDVQDHMSLFVVLRKAAVLDEELRRAILAQVRAMCSPRHVPDEVREITEVPRTLSGKILEVPVKKILMGTPPEQAASKESLANPAALEYFVKLTRNGPARQRTYRRWT
jgi:acetoacetyl-CoA synthetase